jgi:hypothetical protein
VATVSGNKSTLDQRYSSTVKKSSAPCIVGLTRFLFLRRRFFLAV